MTTKTCSKCKIEKSVSDFYTRKKYGYASQCKSCHKEGSRKAFHKRREENPEWYRTHLDRTNSWKRENRKTYGRKADLKKNYGITIEEYETLLDNQNGVCYICQNECPSGRRLAVDHCHETDKIRGLLCCKCNTGLGS